MPLPPRSPRLAPPRTHVCPGRRPGPLSRPWSERGVMTTPLRSAPSTSRRRAGSLDLLGLAGRLPRRALFGRQAPHQPQRPLSAAPTPQPRWPFRRRALLGIRGFAGDAGMGGARLRDRRTAEQELDSPELRATGRVQEPERTDTVKALGRHMLEEAAQKLRRRQCHRTASRLATSPVQERDRLVVARDDRLARKRGPVHVPSQVVEHPVGSLDRRLAERERGDGDQVALSSARHGDEGAAIGGEAAACERVSKACSLRFGCSERPNRRS